MKNLLVGVKNVLLWSYERGSWQYDVLCLLIIAAMFLIPSRYFGDRDRTPPQAKRRVAVQANESRPEASNPATSLHESEIPGEEIIWSDDLRAFLARTNQPAERINPPEEAIVLYLHDRLRREVALAREPEAFSNAEGRAGYRVWYTVK
jgi:hypothetical protein